MSISLKNISVTYNKGLTLEKRVLKDVSLDAVSGEFIAIIGNNGAGKSTLAKLIAGEIIVDSGKVIIDNEDVTYLKDFERSRLISRVFQDPRLGTAANLTVLENLAFANHRGKARTLSLSINQGVKKYLANKLEGLGIGLEKKLSEPVFTLSGGQRQVLSLLMAILQPAKVLLLDEHTAALDPDSAAMVMKFTNQLLKERNMTTIMITHDMHEIAYCDAVYAVNDGKIQKVEENLN